MSVDWNRALIVIFANYIVTQAVYYPFYVFLPQAAIYILWFVQILIFGSLFKNIYLKSNHIDLASSMFLLSLFVILITLG